MESQKGQAENKGFTIIELLTVMSIIVILIGLLVPALNQVRRFATKVKQNAQFHAIDSALELYRVEHGQYPDSKALDKDGLEYCGAMKLTEALMGQDLMGYHPDSQFRVSDFDTSNASRLYRNPNRDPRERAGGIYLEAEKVDTTQLKDLLTPSGFGPVSETAYVMTDAYRRNQNLSTTGPSKLGLPVLYYKADTTGVGHDPRDPDSGISSTPTKLSNNGAIYNYTDNQEIINAAPGNQPWSETGTFTPAPDPLNFYTETRNEKIPSVVRPYRQDSYILISAGWDGLYGTSDDVTNFDALSN